MFAYEERKKMSERENTIVIEATDRSKSKPTCRVLISDFANMVKAFIGSNYLTIAYAFTQSGLVLGIIGLLAIATVTDHCCHLIVKCKYHAIEHVLGRKARRIYSSLNSNDGSLEESEGEDSENEDSQEKKEIYKQMCRSFTYGDVGKIAYGGAGLFVVNVCLLFTQFGFCVGYFIFVGNTMFSLFPYDNKTISLGETTNLAQAISSAAVSSSDMSSNTQEVNGISNLTQDLNMSFIDALDYLATNISNISTTVMPPTEVPAVTIEPTVLPMLNMSHYVGVTEAPDLRLLVIAPLPIFVGFAFLRNVRHLGFVSVAADVSIFVGCIVTMCYIIAKFSLSSTWEMFNWSTVAVFFGMVTSSYEGIGTIIPIESSMEGNRHNFNKFLHGAIFILTAVLTLFGVMGYLQYGDNTAQMLNGNIPTSNGFGMSLNVLLCVGVILTFPLQIFPVIELTELYIFGHGRICGPSGSDDDSDDEYGGTQYGRGSDKAALLPKEEVKMPAPVAQTVPDEVSTWKRNVLRIFIVCVAAGLAVLMRDLFAYVSAFVGAIGSSVLAYILPCLFHLKLCWNDVNIGIRIKDFLIIIFGIAASVISLYTTIKEVVDKFS